MYLFRWTNSMKLFSSLFNYRIYFLIYFLQYLPIKQSETFSYFFHSKWFWFKNNLDGINWFSVKYPIFLPFITTACAFTGVWIPKNFPVPSMNIHILSWTWRVGQNLQFFATNLSYRWVTEFENFLFSSSFSSRISIFRIRNF